MPAKVKPVYVLLPASNTPLAESNLVVLQHVRQPRNARSAASNAGPERSFSIRREVLKLAAVLVLLGATLLLMPGCGPEPRRVEAAGLTCFARTGICRFHDAEASVTCWTTGDSRGGVACLRDLPTAEGRP